MKISDFQTPRMGKVVMGEVGESSIKRADRIEARA
jgi:hypothetical protein